MDKQKEKSEVLFKATGQGYSIIIHGKRGEDGSWKCAIEENEITFSNIPKGEHINSLDEKRDYEKSEFEYLFEEAIDKIKYTEWFLCHPDKLNSEFAEFVIGEFEKKMEEYNNEFPVEGSMDQYIRENKAKEWRAKAGMA